MLQQERFKLQKQSNELISSLKRLHVNFEDSDKFYPRFRLFNSAIYDSNKELIFSTLKNPKVNLDDVIYTNHKFIHFIKEPESYYLGARYVLVESKDSDEWLLHVRDNLIIFILVALNVMVFGGYFLSKLFLKPMRNALHLLDNFIKDTTHELNTPVSSIIANISMIDAASLEDEKLKRKINRIDIGAKTISNIYEDLTFTVLNHQIMSQNESLSIKDISTQRVEYFKILADAKNIRVTLHVEDDFSVVMDKKKLSKLLDNLLSNAIKYNKHSGHIDVTIRDRAIHVEDSGIGIESEKLSYLFQRYSRFEKSVGGFGLGMNIVKMICDEYKIEISVKSTLHVGTKVSLKW